MIEYNYLFMYLFVYDIILANKFLATSIMRYERMISVALYTERNGIRKPKEKTYTVSRDQYDLLFHCCDKYKENLMADYPMKCPESGEYCGFDQNMFNRYIQYDIPDLFRRNGIPAVPGVRHNVFDEEPKPDMFDQYALFDYIELFAQKCRDVRMNGFHFACSKNHYVVYDSDTVFDSFRKEINRIFTMTGLSYVLTEDKIIERVMDDSIVSPELIQDVAAVKEPGLQKLLTEAISRFKCTDPDAPRDAAEKIWDAFERLKTYYTQMNKQDSVNKIINDMAKTDINYVDLFTAEFRALTKLGNDYRIRHHETSKIDIPDPNYYDYFYNRCLSIIGLAIKYLQ